MPSSTGRAQDGRDIGASRAGAVRCRQFSVVFKNCGITGEVTAVTSNASYAGGIVSMMKQSSPEGTLVFDGCQKLR